MSGAPHLDGAQSAQWVLPLPPSHGGMRECSAMDTQPIWAALVAHQWILFAALLVGGIIAVVKQGWVSTWLAQRLPARAVPFVAIALSIGTLTTGEIIAGTPWAKALFDGLSAGLLAVFGHEAIVEGIRNGKEIVPPTKDMRALAAVEKSSAT
jgi:hypothetical protein